MAFRAYEAAEDGFETARKRLVSRSFSDDERLAATKTLEMLVDSFGPVVKTYPTWHPLVAQHSVGHPGNTPCKANGYEGLDHTVYFAQAFVTCPYGNGEEVISSVGRLPYHPCARICAKALETTFYNTGTTAVLVSCDWSLPLQPSHTIPACLAVPLMLEKELPCWRWSQRAETWDTMRHYFLGSPHGARSSLFVTQETALALKRTYECMAQSGMFDLSLGGRVT